MGFGLAESLAASGVSIAVPRTRRTRPAASQRVRKLQVRLAHPSRIAREGRPDRIGIILVTLGQFEGQPVIQVSEQYAGLLDKALAKLRVNAIFLVNYSHEVTTRFRKARGWDDGEDERFLVWLTNNHKPFGNLNPNELKISVVS